MISGVELVILLVYIGMAGYIVYLQDKLKKADRFGAFMAALVHDVMHDRVTIHKTEDGFTVKHKGDQ
jgi:hypothetical protein